MRLRYLLLPLSLVLCAATAHADIAAARAKMDQYRTAARAARQAAQQNNQKAYQASSKKALSLLGEARDLFEAAGIDHSKDISALLDYADNLSATGDADLAAKTLRRVVTLNPHNSDAWFRLGRALMALGSPRAPKAIEAFRRARDLEQNKDTRADIEAALGRLFMREGYFDFAREQYRAALKSNPDNTRAKIGLAGLDARDGKVAEASKSLDQIGQPPADLEFEFRQVMKQALTDFQRNRRWFPDTAENNFAYAKLLIRANYLGTSIEPLKRAAKLDSDNYVIWNMLGSVSQALGDAATARDAYNRSLKLKPDQPRTKQSLDSLKQSAPSK